MHKVDRWNELTTIYLDTIKKVRPYITPDEHLVLMFIFERTYGYKKDRETIPLRHFMQGVRTAGGEIVTTRVGLSKTNLLRAIRHLENKCIIFSDYMRRGGATYYGINQSHEIDYRMIQRYISSEQLSEVSKGLLTNQPTKDALTRLTTSNLVQN